jgi:hypothetical protein
VLRGKGVIEREREREKEKGERIGKKIKSMEMKREAKQL